MKKIIGILLAHANRVPDLYNKDVFYKAKNCLLDKYGTDDGYDLQHIAGKKCFTCGGAGVFERYYSQYDEECYRCDGTGWCVYTKQEAISEAKGCDGITIIAINNAEHNQRLNEYIENIKKRMILWL